MAGEARLLRGAAGRVHVQHQKIAEEGTRLFNFNLEDIVAEPLGGYVPHSVLVAALQGYVALRRTGGRLDHL